MNRAWIQTYTGRVHDLEHPDPAHLDLRDIAHALSQINRFTGHTKKPYSVAQHCVLVSRMLSPELKLCGLMHDAAEAYIADINSPLKRLLGESYASIEREHEQAIATRWGLPHPWPLAVKVVDTRLMLTEVRDLLGPSPQAWQVDAEPYAPDVLTVVPWTAREAEERWLWAYDDLTG